MADQVLSSPISRIRRSPMELMLVDPSMATLIQKYIKMRGLNRGNRFIVAIPGLQAI